MRLMFDTNVLLDVFQKREPHYHDSAMCLNLVVTEKMVGVVPAHTVSTLYYLLNKYTNRDRAVEAIRRILDDFEVAECSGDLLRRALDSGEADFEDSIVAVSASETSCDWILTRNLKDFSGSTVVAQTPTEFLTRLD